jgi:predicted dehydrogenase
MLKAARETKRVLKCGFNHRHHPAIWEAKRLLDKGDLGKPIFARCRYGICGRPGYEKEWRADPARAAGGQFIEQGTHAIDLFRWFMGDIAEVSCMTALAYFKEQSMEDNGAALFRMKSGAIAMLHTSLTQWKNQFSFEVFGSDGYIVADGLGASYGTETLSIGKRDFNAPFQDHVIEYRGGDNSWRDEWKEFAAAVREGREPVGDGRDGLEAMKASLAAYEAEKSRRTLAPG